VATWPSLEEQRNALEAGNSSVWAGARTFSPQQPRTNT